MYLQKYILHLYRYFTSEDQENKYNNIYFAIEIFAILSKCGFTSITESESVFLFFTICFFGGMMANVDMHIYTRELHVKNCFIRV